MELVAKFKGLQILVHLFKVSVSRTDCTASNRSGLISEENRRKRSLSAYLKDCPGIAWAK